MFSLPFVKKFRISLQKSGLTAIMYINANAMKKNFEVRIIIRKDKRKKDDTCPLYLLIKLNGKQFLKLSLGESVPVKNWDSKAQCLVGKGYGTLINNHLKRSVMEIEDYIAEQKERGKSVTKEMIVSFFKKEDAHCFYKFFDEVFYPEKAKETVDSTMVKYRLFRKRLKEFKPNLSIKTIDTKLILEFENFLLSKENIGVGALRNYHKNFKTALKMACSLKLMDLNDFPYNNFKVKRPKPKSNALTLNDVQKIIDADLGNKKNLEDTRIKFLFSCYTGLRFSDVTNLKWDNIENGVITVKQVKTKKMVKVPICKQAKQIIAKNVKQMKNREFVFDKMSNQRTNKNLKKVAKIAGIEEDFTFHTARHTFGTILANDQMNAFTIAKLMGHKNIAMTSIYVNSNVEDLKQTMKSINFGM